MKIVKVQTKFSKCSFWPDAASTSSGNLLRIHISTESEILEAKPRNLGFKKALQVILMFAKLWESLILDYIVCRIMANWLKLWGNGTWVQYKKNLVLVQAGKRRVEVNEFYVIGIIQT